MLLIDRSINEGARAMPPRDEQDYETRRQQIIDGALQVFATKGFERATNKDIALASKIGSPGLIYHARCSNSALHPSNYLPTPMS
jgi:AcrR family transcriptional regulator